MSATITKALHEQSVGKERSLRALRLSGITSNRPLEDWAKPLGDVVIAGPLLDRLMHHGHLLRFDGKSWRLKEAAARVAKRDSTE